MKYLHRLTSSHNNCWEKALSYKKGLLAQRNSHCVTSIDTISFIPFFQEPSNQPVTYASFVCDHHRLKAEHWRVWIIVCGDKFKYNEDVGSPVASLLETKILINSTMSYPYRLPSARGCIGTHFQYLRIFVYIVRMYRHWISSEQV